MNLLTQGESSVSSVHPAKRKRGRPRKDQSLKSPEAAHAPASAGVKEDLPLKTGAPEPILGQVVTGVVEAAFDSGYLLSVKIGNSIMRGIVFKPGHCVPITAENDVAPHIPMIKRNNLRVSGIKKGSCRGQESATQTALKRKNELPETAVNPSGLDGNADVEMVEPLSMLPPVHFVSAGQIFVASGMQQNDDGLFNKDTTVVEQEKDNTQGSSPTLLDGEIEVAKEALKSPADSGEITELFKALQEDANEGEVQIFDEPASVTRVEFDEVMAAEANDDISTQITLKHKYELPQTVVNASGLQLSNDGDADVEMIELLSMVPPIQSVPVVQIFVDEIAPGMQQGDDGSFDRDTTAVVQLEDNTRGSSQALLDGEMTDIKEAVESPAENGEITELFKALQEDVNEIEVQIFEESAAEVQIFDQMISTKANDKNESIVP